jgi:nicotinamide-nucleotide amidase
MPTTPTPQSNASAFAAEIIAIGSELLTPGFVDTNSSYLTEQLNAIGIPVVMKAIVGDDENYLEQAIQGALERTRLLITIGGLGPTEDDVTKKVVARVLHRQLVLDDAVLAGIEKRFKARGVEMPANNARQALVLTGSEVIENNHGSAPGLWIPSEKNLTILLPGPPSELKPMFSEICVDRLRKLNGGMALARRVYRTTGLPESALDARIAPIYLKYKNPETTILAKPGQVDVRLTARARTAEEAEEVVGMCLILKQATVGVAESCTGGLIAERLTNIPGSSRYFLSGIVTYSNESKIELAGIPPLVLEMQGAVSEEVARGLAEGIRERLATTIGIGVTGIAGPGGGSEEKPVGTVFIAVAGSAETVIQRHLFTGGRDKVRWQASQAALDLARRVLMRL